MNANEAYKILDVSPNDDKDVIKKKYKQLAKKYHPDVNKESGASEHFKKINEAYDLLTKEQNHEVSNQGGFDQSFDINDIFNSFFNRNHNTFEVINLYEKISFIESVTGCTRNIKFNRLDFCRPCQGAGQTAINNGCTACNGFGVNVVKIPNGQSVQKCRRCHGSVSYKKCTSCNSKGTTEETVEISVQIPPGVLNNSNLTLNGIGNYVRMAGHNVAHYGFANLNVIVEPHNKMTIVNNNVHTKITISLLEALSGTSKKTITIDGEQNIVIPKKSKNGDIITIPNLGVARQGNHNVDIEVSYPEDPSKLIEFLSSGE